MIYSVNIPEPVCFHYKGEAKRPLGRFSVKELWLLGWARAGRVLGEDSIF